MSTSSKTALGGFWGNLLKIMQERTIFHREGLSENMLISVKSKNYFHTQFSILIVLSTLEKVKLSETDFTAINIGSGPDYMMQLYYAAFIAVDGAVCSV